MRHGIEIGYDNNDKYKKDLEDITIANNLITGSENSLVDIVDTDNDQGNKISWSNNLMYPTGNSTLINGATATSFDGMEAINENPHLVFDNLSMTWKTTENSPSYDNASSNGTINEDIEGQNRPNPSTPGADHFSMESIRYKPLTPNDVGPYAYAGMNTSTSNVYRSSEITAYPIPADNILHLTNINDKIEQVEIINAKGDVISTHNIHEHTDEFTIDTTKLLSGIYYLQFSKNGAYYQSKKIVIQH